MSSKSYSSVCRWRKPDCFAWKDMGCLILTDTDIKKKECPFYATEDQVKAARELSKMRLRAKGMSVLIDKYYKETFQ